MLNKIEYLWAFAILFINGWTLALPITSETMPIWLTPVQLIHGVFIHELLLMVYLGFMVAIRGGYLPIRQNNAINFAFLIGGLGCLALLSNVVNVHPPRKMGEAGRFFLLATYLLISVYWEKRHGSTFVLRTLLFGITSAAAINLYYTFTIGSNMLGGLPFLLGQAGPGSAMGISVVLSAWLMLERKIPLDGIVALGTFVVGLLGVSISYSKLSMLMAGCGLIAWGFVLWQAFAEQRSRRLSILVLAMLLVIVFANQGRISQYAQGVNVFIGHKFSDLMSPDNRSVTNRSQYYIITAEIMLGHPLFGVGSAGFYGASTETEGYNNDRAEDEYSDEGSTPNPHNSFLYYASANGLPGLLLAVLLFMKASQAFWLTLSSRGMQGRVLWCCLIVAFFIWGMTLPTLFNTSVLYLSIAVAVALASQACSSDSLIQS